MDWEIFSYFTATNDLHLFISKLISWFVELKTICQLHYQI
jgi:hypothetical protein